MSNRFEVQVGGIEVPVTAYKDVHNARIDFTAPAEVEVEGAAVRFTGPRHLSLVVQLDFREKFFLFFDPPADPVPCDAVDVTTLGATMIATVISLLTSLMSFAMLMLVVIGVIEAQQGWHLRYPGNLRLIRRTNAEPVFP